MASPTHARARNALAPLQRVRVAVGERGDMPDGGVVGRVGGASSTARPPARAACGRAAGPSDATMRKSHNPVFLSALNAHARKVTGEPDPRMRI